MYFELRCNLRQTSLSANYVYSTCYLERTFLSNNGFATEHSISENWLIMSLSVLLVYVLTFTILLNVGSFSINPRLNISFLSQVHL